MATTPSIGGRRRTTFWHLGSWNLRTKIAVVLLLPVLVALVLGGLRVDNQLGEAADLSASRDGLPVLQSTVELAELVGTEMVTAADSDSGDAELRAAVADVDDAAAEVSRSADFAELPPQTAQRLSAALGQLSGLRAAENGGDASARTAGYHEVVDALSDVIPGLLATADVTDLNTSAAAVQSLTQVRADLAAEEALLRSGGSPGRGTIGQAQAMSVQVGVTAQQLVRDRPPGVEAAALDTVIEDAAERQDTLQSALGEPGTVDLRSLLPDIADSAESVSGLLGDAVATLSTTITDRTDDARSDALRDAGIVLFALLAALTTALLVARSLVSPVRRLHHFAVDAARRELPQTVDRIRSGQRVDWQSIEPAPVHTGAEIGQLAAAFDDMHQQAVLLAGEQAELRRQVSEMFMTLSRRSQSLVESQLTVLERLESHEEDPERLNDLFRLDHLATRLRRNGENLQVLAGGVPARQDGGPVTTVELLRAATSEVKDYRRVTLGHAPAGSVRADAAADVMHILAELLDNATSFSAPDEPVVLTADRGADGGVLIEVVDNGLGMVADDIEAANRRLTAGDTVGPETTRRMGLFVVGRLAARHGVAVRLRATATGPRRTGITASVHIPGELVIVDAGEQQPTPPLLSGEASLLIASRTVNGALPGGSARQLPAAPNGAVPTQPPNDGAVPVPPGDDDPDDTGDDRSPLPAMRTPIFDQVVSKWFERGFPNGTSGDSEAGDSEANGTGGDTEAGGTGSADTGPGDPSDVRADGGSDPGGPAGAPADGADAWFTPADEGWRAAEAVAEASADDQPAERVTAAGLPIREVGAQLVPGAAAREQVSEPSGESFRDPLAVKNSLSRHYSGMHAARTRTGQENA